MSARARFFTRLALLAIISITCLWQLGFQPAMSAHDLTIAIPFQVSRGLRLYTDVFSFHPPLSTWFLAAIYRVADPIISLRVLNLAYILTTGGLVFWVGRRLHGTTHGLAGTLFYFLWATFYNSFPFYVDGLVGSFSILVLLLATFSPSPTTLTAMGVAAGIGASLKPSGVLLLIMPFLWLLWSARRDWRTAFKRAGIVLVVEIAVLLVQVGILALSGDLNMAIRAMLNPGNSFVLSDFRVNFFDGAAWRTIALALALVPAYLLLWLRERSAIGFLVVLLLGATLVLNFPTPGYYHFMACLPIVALMSGIVLGTGIQELTQRFHADGWWQRFQRASASSVLLIGITAGLIVASLTTALTPVFGLIQSGPRLVGWDELRPISTWVDQHTNTNDGILILPVYDTNANIYAQADRLPPFYMKTWYHHASIPENIALLQARVLAAPPTLIVFFPDFFVAVEPYFAELKAYIDAHYEEVGRIEDIPFQGDVIFLSLVGTSDSAVAELAGDVE